MLPSSSNYSSIHSIPYSQDGVFPLVPSTYTTDAATLLTEYSRDLEDITCCTTPQRTFLGATVAQLVNFAADDIRPLLLPDLEKMLTARFKRLLHYMLSRVKATNLGGTRTPMDEQVESDLKECLKKITEMMKKRKKPIRTRSSSNKAKLEMETVFDELEAFCKEPLENDKYPHFVGAVNAALELLQPLEIGNAGPSPSRTDPKYLVSVVNDPKVKESIHNGTKYGRKTDVDFAFLGSVRKLPDPQYTKSPFPQLMETLRRVDKKGLHSHALPWKNTLACCEMKVKSANFKPAIMAIQNYRSCRFSEDLSEVAAIPVEEIVTETNDEIERLKAAMPKQNKTNEDEDNVDQEQIASGSSRKRKSDDEADNPVPKRTKGPDGNKMAPSELEPASVEIKSLPTQLAEYAAEAMFNSFGRDHVMNFALTNDVLHVWYFDHQGPIQTTGINIVKDLPHFLLFLYALQRFTAEDWGYIPDLDMLNSDEYVNISSERPDSTNSLGVANPSEAGTPSEEIHIPIAPRRSQRNKPPVVTTPEQRTEDYIFKATKEERRNDYKVYGLTGRNTWVVRGHTYYKKAKVAKVVMKVSFREVNRTREAEFIREAKARCSQNNFEDFCEYLPDILFEKQYPQFSTSIIRDHLNARPMSGIPYSTKAVREPYMMLMPEYEPLTTRTKDWYEFMEAFITLFFVHALLWSLGVEHGDISEKNLMWDPKSKKPKLCDYDLSHFTGASRPSGFSNTGTWQFMALELLDRTAMVGEVQRRYRHDVESFITLLIWILCRFRNGEPIRGTKSKKKKFRTNSILLEGWNQVDFEKIQSRRKATLDKLDTMAIPEGVPKDIWDVCLSFQLVYDLAILDGSVLRRKEKAGSISRNQEMYDKDVQYNSIHFINYFLDKSDSAPLATRLWKFERWPRIQEFIVTNYKFDTLLPVKPDEPVVDSPAAK